MPRFLLAAAMLFTLVPVAAAQKALPPPPARKPLKVLPATVTWLGNSFPGNGLNRGVGNFFPMMIKDIAVARDGTVITTATFNEAFPQSILIKNGEFLRSAPWQMESEAVAYDASSNIFLLANVKSGQVGTGAMPLTASGQRIDVPWYKTDSPVYWQHQLQDGKYQSRKPRGFAFNGDLIYMSEETTNNIQVFRKKDSAWLSPIPVSGTSRLQKADGLLWAIQGTAVIGIDPATGKVARTLPANAVLQPVSLTADKWGRLLVGDAHPERRRIAIFDPATGKRIATFGRLGGPWGPGNVPGRAGDAVFEYPFGLGCDAAGNLYVGDAGAKWPQNASVSCYKALASGSGAQARHGWSTVPAWSVRGSSWSDTVAVDPTDTTVLWSAWFKYKFDYAAAPGQGWKIAATTLNRQKYPEDARLNVYTLGRHFRGLRVIEGKKFLYSGKMDVFRLGDTGEGDTAVPCAVVLPRAARFEYGTPGWPPNAPGYGDSEGYVWTDANRDGAFDKGEYRRFGNGEFQAGEWSLWMYLDDAANIWLLPTGDKRRGFYHRMQGLTYDAPVYDDVSQRTAVSVPSRDGLGQINYSCLNEKTGDLLVLSRRDGRADMSLTCYANWRALAIAGKGEAAPIRYRVDGVSQGPAINTNGGYSGDYIGGMRTKNEFLFLADAMGAGIRVYRAETGAPVGRIDAGELGARQPMDNTEGLQVSTRGTAKTLEYVIIRDCWLTNKMLMMRWKP